jgi:hypothetical protein
MFSPWPGLASDLPLNLYWYISIGIPAWVAPGLF